MEEGERQKGCERKSSAHCYSTVHVLADMRRLKVVSHMERDVKQRCQTMTIYV